MSKALLCTKPGKADIGDVVDPSLGEQDVKIRCLYASAKHGTELAAFRGEDPHENEYFDEEWKLFLPRPQAKSSTGPLNLGSQFIGEIVEKGSQVAAFSIGDIVCGYGGIREYQIHNGVHNHDLRLLPTSMRWQDALCHDPTKFALAGIRDSQMRVGDALVVVGLGAIGQIAVQLAKLGGASLVVAVDPIEKRRKVALHNGADVALDPVGTDVGYELKQLTGKRGMDAAIDTSANEFALQQLLRGIAYGGTIAFVGWARPFLKGGLDWGKEAHFNNARLVFSRACSEPNPDHPRWDYLRIKDECWRILASGVLDCTSIIDPVVPFLESDRGFETYVNEHPELSIKLGVKF